MGVQTVKTPLTQDHIDILKWLVDNPGFTARESGPIILHDHYRSMRDKQANHLRCFVTASRLLKLVRRGLVRQSYAPGKSPTYSITDKVRAFLIEGNMPALLPGGKP